MKNKTEQMEDFFLKQIRDGILQPGSKIPSERELGEQLSVSRVIVRRALAKLEQDKVLVRTESGARIVNELTSVASRPCVGFALHSRWIRDTYFLNIIQALEDKSEGEFEIKIFFHNMTRQNIYLKENIGILFLDHVYSDNEIRILEDCGIFSIALLRESVGNNYICFDALGAGYNLGKHLFEQGHKNIVHFSHAPPIAGSESFFRREGLLQAQAEFGFNLIPVDIFLSEDSGITDIRSAVDYLFTAQVSFSAIIAPDEKGAVEINEILENMGFNMSDDVSLATFGNNYAMSRLSFSLCTAAFSTEKIAESLLGVVRNWLKRRKSFICKEKISATIICKAQ